MRLLFKGWLFLHASLHKHLKKFVLKFTAYALTILYLRYELNQFIPETAIRLWSPLRVCYGVLFTLTRGAPPLTFSQPPSTSSPPSSSGSSSSRSFFFGFLFFTILFSLDLSESWALKMETKRVAVHQFAWFKFRNTFVSKTQQAKPDVERLTHFFRKTTAREEVFSSPSSELSLPLSTESELQPSSSSSSLDEVSSY